MEYWKDNSKENLSELERNRFRRERDYSESSISIEEILREFQKRVCQEQASIDTQFRSIMREAGFDERYNQESARFRGILRQNGLTELLTEEDTK